MKLTEKLPSDAPRRVRRAVGRADRLAKQFDRAWTDLATLAERYRYDLELARLECIEAQRKVDVEARR